MFLKISKRPRWKIKFRKCGGKKAEVEQRDCSYPMRHPQHLLFLLLPGRSPGSQVLICRLPMRSPFPYILGGIAHSGILANPHSLTVAGAAQASGLFPHLFPV